jgi:hypothetical protein
MIEALSRLLELPDYPSQNPLSVESTFDDCILHGCLFTLQNNPAQGPVLPVTIRWAFHGGGLRQGKIFGYQLITPYLLHVQ